MAVFKDDKPFYDKEPVICNTDTMNDYSADFYDNDDDKTRESLELLPLNP